MAIFWGYRTSGMGIMRRCQTGILAAAFLLLAAVPSRAQRNEQGHPMAGLAFPEIRDWKTLEIKLGRRLSAYPNPAYTVTIRGDGTVRYDGTANVAVTGTHIGHISSSAVKALLGYLSALDFMNLRDSYISSEDAPVNELSLSFDGTIKTIIERVGRLVGMPAAITPIEAQIDRLAGIEKWTEGNDETIPALKAEGWDFRARNDANLALLRKLARPDHNGALALAFSKEGGAVDNSFGCEALVSAIFPRNKPALEALLAAGAPMEARVPVGPYIGRCSLLVRAATVGNADLTKLALSQHPDINLRDVLGQTVLFVAVKGWLEGDDLAESFGAGDYPAIVRLLLAAGADPSIGNSHGVTPLDYAKESFRDSEKVHAAIKLLSSNKKGNTKQ